MSVFSVSSQSMLGDFITPSQACIKPLLAAIPGAGTPGGRLTLHSKGDVAPKEFVKITLQDCLACSGCVTTAETLLVQQQSRTELLSLRQAAPDSPPRWLVVSVSDQSAASIAVQLGCSSDRAFRLVSGFLRDTIRANAVVDLRWAQRVVIRETASELVHRLSRAAATGDRSALPLLVTACPGWVCYCEKSHPQLLPLLSPVVSAQALCGRFLKRVLWPLWQRDARAWAAHGAQLLHVSVQPCFDKKLEAVRSDFEQPPPVEGAGTATRDTDIVLGTQELFEWMVELRPELGAVALAADTASGSLPADLWDASLDSDSLDQPIFIGPADDLSPESRGALRGSGCWHQAAIAAMLGQVSDAPHASALAADTEGKVQYESRRNDNHRAITHPSLVDPGTKRPLTFGIGYGFQHLQNLAKSAVKRKEFCFLEVMACPGGCLNGGAQVRHQRQTLEQQRAALERVQATYAKHESSCLSAANGDPPRREAENGNGEEPLARYFTVEAVDTWLRHALDAADDRPGIGCKADRSAWPAGGTRGAHPLVCTAFHDRQAEMAAMDNVAHSLKW